MNLLGFEKFGRASGGYDFSVASALYALIMLGSVAVDTPFKMKTALDETPVSFSLSDVGIPVDFDIPFTPEILTALYTGFFIWSVLSARSFAKKM